MDSRTQHGLTDSPLEETNGFLKADTALSVTWKVAGAFAVLLNSLSLSFLAIGKELTTIQKASIVSFGLSDLFGAACMIHVGSLRNHHMESECSFEQWGLMMNNCTDMYLLLFFTARKIVVLRWPRCVTRLASFWIALRARTMREFIYFLYPPSKLG